MILLIHDRLFAFSGKPRASGDDPPPCNRRLKTGVVNPARAGMIPLFDASWAVIDCKPRASGDDPSRIPSPHRERT